MKFIKDNFKKLLFYFFCLVGLVLLYLPKDYFDSGQSVCLSVVVFNRKCYACGMTRGIQHLIHFDFAKAYSYNVLSFIVFPLIVFMVTNDFIKSLRNKKVEKVNEENS